MHESADHNGVAVIGDRGSRQERELAMVKRHQENRRLSTQQMQSSSNSSKATAAAGRSAFRFVVLLGIVSLFADMTYEGARSITGPYLGVLGASGLVVGLVAGLGELIGYALRLASGYLADRTARYWTITLAGYALNLFAVPLLALAGRWEVAAALMIAERMGKAIRTPARDAMLSHATAEIGHGWGFGLHEALDQIGAVLGPLLVAAVLAAGQGYRTGFGMLLLPALLSFGMLVTARRIYPRPADLESVAVPWPHDGPDFPRIFWFYLIAAAAIAAGYADFPLIAFHFGVHHVVAPTWIPVLYAVAMGVDAVAAIIFGRLFDRFGLPALIVSTLISAPFATLVFRGNVIGAVIGMALWGAGMGAQESILRAAIATLVPRHRRGTAYGLFNAAYGLAWFMGSAILGYLYDISPGGLVAFSVLAQLAAIPLLLAIGRGGRAPHTPPV
jgi:MFS family permease